MHGHECNMCMQVCARWMYLAFTSSFSLPMCQLIVITVDSDPQCNVTFIKCLKGVWVGDFFKSSAVNRLC